MEEYFTKEQVIELLKEQRENCGEAYYKKADLDFQAYILGAIDEAPCPSFPAPIQVIPVEKVREVVRALKEQLAQMDYDIRIDPEFYADKKEQLKEDIEMIEKLLADGK